MEMYVKHRTFGLGKVVKLDDNFIEVYFGNQKKTFQFPQAFGKFLETDNTELLCKLEEARKKLNTKPSTLAPKAVSHNPKPQYSHAYEPHTYSYNPLVGERAQTIYVGSEAEMFEIVGYLASPGRVNSIEAEVPKDGRDKIFEELFPGQMYRPIEVSTTPSGLSNKLGPQFRINLSNVRNCPQLLKVNMGRGNSSCVGRINKSRFVIDLVQNYGFHFGYVQDTNAIRNIAKERGYIDEFVKGFLR